MRKTIAMMAMIGMMVLTGCQGFLGMDYDSVKYISGSKHEAMAQCASATAKGYEAKMVVGERDGVLTAWAEVEGNAVDRTGSPRRLLPNPMWPFAMLKATKRGTPRELGLYGTPAAPSTRHWLLFTSEHKRLIGHYEACKALHPATVVATDGTHYWLEVTVGGKLYAETTRQGHLDHYNSKPPKGFKEIWSGTLAEYEALGKLPSDPAKQEASRKASRAQIALIPARYWLKR